jgi:hypothetical protein
MTVDNLKNCSVKDLAEMARKRGVRGWQEMKKDQLVRAILRTAAKRPATSAKRPNSSKRSSTAKAAKKVKAPTRRHAVKQAARSTKAKPIAKSHSPKSHKNGHAHLPAKTTKRVELDKKAEAKAKDARIASRIAARSAEQMRALGMTKEKMERIKNLAYGSHPGKPGGFTKDRLVVMVRDPYWLHAYWELTRAGVQRAEAALSQEWHMAKPVLRLVEIANQGTTTNSETVVRNITIHGGVNNWYVDVQDPPKTYRMDVGYLTPSGKFYALARSNLVSTPRAGMDNTIDKNWTDVAEHVERIYAMSGGYSAETQTGELQELLEERLRRPVGAHNTNQSGFPLNGKRRKDFKFSLDAELIVYGTAEPNARVTLQGDPVQLRSDGTFTVRFSLPDSRQIIPAVAQSPDGTEQRTIVLAVERNTKTMEPVLRDQEDQ